MTLNTYDPGDTVKILYSPVDGNGAAYDPSAVKFHYASPDGTDYTKIYGTDAVATRLSAGHYQLLISIPYTNTSAGEWNGDGQSLDGSANSLNVEKFRFIVRRLATLD